MALVAVALRFVIYPLTEGGNDVINSDWPGPPHHRRVGRPRDRAAHFATALPSTYQNVAIVLLSLITLVAVLLLARHVRSDFRSAAAVLIADGVLVSPHALLADLVLVAAGLAVWGEAKWHDWLVLSVGAAITAFVPPPVLAIVGVLLAGWLCLRAARLSAWRRGLEPASAR